MDDGGLIKKNNDLIKNSLGADSPESSKKINKLLNNY